jgi:trehalose 6-phosphate synthase
LVRHLLAYDLVGFQTSRDVEAFYAYARRELAAEISEDGRISAHDLVTHAAAFPIGIDTETFAKLAGSATAQRHANRMTQSLADRRMIIGVDRLDYSKGLPQRFQAFEMLLERYPVTVNHVSFVQIAPQSRSDVQEYIAIREELAMAAGDINGRFAEFDWVPIRYVNKAYERAALAGMFRVADVGLVTPLRDGMNLVAKEYIAAQDPDDPGVLVLSQFAGAAEQLTAALIVNPHDVQDVADAMHRALKMPRGERRQRYATMMERLKRENVAAWCENFLQALRFSAEDRNLEITA